MMMPSLNICAISKMNRAVFVLVAVIIAILGYLYYYAVSSVYRISSEEAKELIRNKQIDLILDVRTDAERDALGSYPGSVHIQSADLEREMAKRYPDRSMRILAYCNTGQRARAATDKLHALGYGGARYILGTYRSLI
jgi:rhodanese-related sulfurtransferase